MEMYVIEGSLEVKISTIWTEEKQRRKSEDRVKEEKRREEQVRESQKKEDAGARKGRKVGEILCFLVFCGTRGAKSRLAEVAGAEPAQKCQRLRALSLFGSVGARCRCGER